MQNTPLVNGGMLGVDFSPGLRQQWRSSLFPPYNQLSGLIDLEEICFPSPQPLIYTLSQSE